jgi:hypothetical protein
VVTIRTLAHFADSIDEGGNQILQPRTRFLQTSLEHALLIGEFAQAPFCFQQHFRMQVAGHQVLHRGQLAGKPGFVADQFADVEEQQAHQTLEAGPASSWLSST